MATLLEDIVRDLARTEIELGGGTADTFTWKTKEVPCAASSVRRGLELELGGNYLTVSLTLFVRRHQFLTADNTLITIDSNLYTVDNENVSIDDSSINASYQPITLDSDLPIPVAGRTLVFRGQTLRIIAAREVAPRSHFELTLAEAGSNR